MYEKNNLDIFLIKDAKNRAGKTSLDAKGRVSVIQKVIIVSDDKGYLKYMGEGIYLRRKSGIFIRELERNIRIGVW